MTLTFAKNGDAADTKEVTDDTCHAHLLVLEI